MWCARATCFHFIVGRERSDDSVNGGGRLVFAWRRRGIIFSILSSPATSPFLPPSLPPLALIPLCSFVPFFPLRVRAEGTTFTTICSFYFICVCARSLIFGSSFYFFVRRSAVARSVADESSGKIVPQCLYCRCMGVKCCARRFGVRMGTV